MMKLLPAEQVAPGKIVLPDYDSAVEELAMYHSLMATIEVEAGFIRDKLNTFKKEVRGLEALGAYIHSADCLMHIEENHLLPMRMRVHMMEKAIRKHEKGEMDLNAPNINIPGNGAGTVQTFPLNADNVAKLQAMGMKLPDELVNRFQPTDNQEPDTDTLG